MTARNKDLQWARRLWKLPPNAVAALSKILDEHYFSIRLGDILYLDGKWYVTHTGLLRLAHRSHCQGIEVSLVRAASDVAVGRWVFRATVYKCRARKQFVGYGDADPSNVSPLVRGAEMRVAETRAVNRALRKAYGIGICSVEEIGSFERSSRSEGPVRKLPPESSNGNGSNGHSGNGNGTRVRDRLCELIRRHKLDAELVKAYAVDFCGSKTLREASREQVESFVSHLADQAAKDRSSLLCQLNSYAHQNKGAA